MVHVQIFLPLFLLVIQGNLKKMWPFYRKIGVLCNVYVVMIFLPTCWDCLSWCCMGGENYTKTDSIILIQIFLNTQKWNTDFLQNEIHVDLPYLLYNRAIPLNLIPFQGCFSGHGLRFWSYFIFMFIHVYEHEIQPWNIFQKHIFWNMAMLGGRGFRGVFEFWIILPFSGCCKNQTNHSIPTIFFSEQGTYLWIIENTLWPHN